MPDTISSPADLGRLLFPMATPLEEGVYVVLLTAELRVVGMERLDADATPEVVVQVALGQGATVVAVARTVAGDDLVGGAWAQSLLAEQQVLDVLLVTGVRWRSVREWLGGV